MRMRPHKLRTAVVRGVLALLPLLVVPVAALAQVSGETGVGLVTAWGAPDLSGVWDTRGMTPLERPEQFAEQAFLTDEQAARFERETIARRNDDDITHTVHSKEWLDYGNELYADKRTALIVDPADGRVPPLTAEGRRRADVRRAERAARGPADAAEDRSLFERCLTRGLPTVMLPGPYNGNVQILQTPNEVAILTEMIHEVRIVPLDGRPHLPAAVRQWMGDSRGWWEGETLVVETTNFTAHTPFRGSGANLQLQERFTRVAADTVEYEFTVTDDTTWQQPWSAAFPLTRTDGLVYEYACHEGNYALRNILSYARAEEVEPLP